MDKFQRGKDSRKTIGIGRANKIQEIANNTMDAYSFESYGESLWKDIIDFLIEGGYSQSDIEGILRNKLMRYALDSGVSNLEDFREFFTNYASDYGIDFDSHFENMFLPSIFNEEMGGVSAPMATPVNTPGTGSAQPATTAATSAASFHSQSSVGSGDRWDSSIGPVHTQGKSQKKKKKKKKVNESLGYVRYDGDHYEILARDLNRNRIYIKPTRSPYGGPAHSSPVSTFPFWVSTDSPNLKFFDDGVNENNINPHDKIGVSMAKKMGVPLSFKKGKGDKDVEQEIYDSTIEKDGSIITLDEWIKKFSKA